MVGVSWYSIDKSSRNDRKTWTCSHCQKDQMWRERRRKISARHVNSNAVIKRNRNGSPNTDNRSSVRSKFDQVAEALQCAFEQETSARTNSLTEESKPPSLKEVIEEIKARNAALAETPKPREVVRATIDQELTETRHIAIDLKLTGFREGFLQGTVGQVHASPRTRRKHR